MLNAQAQLIAAGVSRAQSEHAIAVLMGRPPAGLSIPHGSLATSVPSVPVGLPSSLLERRPDVAAAEETMRQANAEIGVAFAGYFPAVSLNGLVGYSGNPFAAAFGPTNPVWSFGASVAQPLFNGGLTTAQVEAARQTYQADVATYRQTVLTAIQQVEDALVGIRIYSREVKVQAENVRISRQATQITLNEYQAGHAGLHRGRRRRGPAALGRRSSAHDPGAGPDRGGRPPRCARRRLDPIEIARRRGPDVGHSAALRKPHAIDRRAGRGRKSLIREGRAMIKAIRIGVAALAASAVLAGCVSIGAPEKEGQLAAAGFVRQPADTPLKMTKLQALPQNTIVVAQRKGHNVYIYADAAGCGCAFIGNDAAYQQYQQIRTANNIAQMQETTAILNQEAAMDWGGAWGPYAPGWY